jgi:hypothetical protein
MRAKGTISKATTSFTARSRVPRPKPEKRVSPEGIKTLRQMKNTPQYLLKKKRAYV